MHSFPFISDEDFFSSCNDLIKVSDVINASAAGTTDWLVAEMRSENGQKYLRILKASRSCSFVEKEYKSDDDDDDDGHVSVDVEEHDESIHPRAVDRETSSTVEYHIIRSPIYRVPVLWVVVPPKASADKSQSGYIYENIVPPELKCPAKSSGLYGGLSLADHPLLGVPAYFVHPCNTAEALQSLGKNDIKPVEYLILWLGLVGGSVQLFVPPSLAIGVARL